VDLGVAAIVLPRARVDGHLAPIRELHPRADVNVDRVRAVPLSDGPERGDRCRVGVPRRYALGFRLLLGRRAGGMGAGEMGVMGARVMGPSAADEDRAHRD
jgi:hypothetical protein